MTKREVLLEFAARQDRLLVEIEAITKVLSLYNGHEAMIAVSCGRAASSRLRTLANRPEMVSDITFVDPA